MISCKSLSHEGRCITGASQVVHRPMLLVPALENERHAVWLIPGVRFSVLGNELMFCIVTPPQTRMMAQKKSPEGIQYSGFLDALVKIPRQEGIMAMYKVLL